MTTQAKPKFEKTTFFNSSFYDIEINNNITKQEASNTYLEKPINQSTGLLNSVLTLTNTTTKETSWTTPATAITNYVNYNNTSKNLISNVSGTPTTITDLIMSDSIGASTPQKFILPSNTSTAQLDSILTLSNISTKQTTWTPKPIVLTDYVDYNDVKDTLIRYNINILGPETITDLVIGSIGSNISQKFILPSNTSTGVVNSVLTLTNISTRETSWTTPATAVTNYVNYNNTSKNLISNVSGTPTTITDLIMSDSIGASTPQKFILPSNTSTAQLDSILTLSNISTKQTTWTPKPIVLTDYVDYNDVKDTLIRYNINILGPETITDLVIGSIGSNISQKFILPSNTSTGVVNSVLTLTNISTRETQWLTIPTQISSYVNYNNANSTLISNVSGTPTTITSINGGTITGTSLNVSGSIDGGNITGTSLSAGTGLISTTGSLQSRGLAIKNTSNADVATISNLGAIIATSLNSGSGLVQTTGNLQSRGLAIKNTSNADVATISNLGAIIATSLNSGSGLVQTTGNLQSRGLTIKNTSNVDVATISNLGAIIATSLNSGSGLVQTTGNLQSRGLTIKNTSNVDVATISNLGAISCTTITSNNNTINAGTSSVSGGTILSSVYNSGAPSSALDIGGNQVAGQISIGNNLTRTGAVNICTLTSNNAINIGNSSTTQQLNINRPIRLPGLVYTNGQEIGYTQNNAVFFSGPTGNPVVPNTRMNTSITATNLINNANYMIKYSLLIIPQANFNVSRFQYGLYDTGYMISLSQNNSVLSGTATTIRFDTSDTYTYSGSGFFKYDSTKTYNLSFTMGFLSTAPYVQTNIDLIRIS